MRTVFVVVPIVLPEGDREIPFVFDDLPSKLWIGGLDANPEISGFLRFEGDILPPRNPDMGKRRVVTHAVLVMVLLVSRNPTGFGADLEFARPRAGLFGVEPPHRSIYTVIEDRDGFLWIGTLDGLGRYDGYEMLVFRHDPDDPATLSNNAIHVLLEDRSGVLWVGTEDGLASLDRRSLRFTRHPVPELNHGGGLIITCGHEDRQGRLWFGSNHGLLLTGPDRGVLQVFKPGPDDPFGLEHPAVIGIDEESNGSLWVATSSVDARALHRLDPERMVFDRVAVTGSERWSLAFLVDAEDRGWLHPGGPVALATGEVGPAKRIEADLCTTTRVMLETPDGMLWIGCDDGLFSVDPANGTVRHQLLVEGDEAYLENYVRALGTGPSGTLWVGTQGGLFRLDPNAKLFEHRIHRPELAESLSARAVSSVVEAPNGSFWVGTFGGGLNHFDPAMQHASRYCTDPAAPDKCPGDVIWDLHLDGEGTLWIAGGGLWSLDTATDRLQRHCTDGDLPEEGLAYIVEAPAGALWLAGFDRRLYHYRVASGVLEAFDVSGEPTREWMDPRIDSLLIQDHELWIGSGDWLGRFDLESGALERVQLESPGGVYLGSQGTWALHPGRDGRLWLGTANGLLAYQAGNFTAWTTRDGLPGSAVYSILEDNQGRLWLGTNQGLSCFDPQAPSDRRFRNYTTADGIGNVEFNRHAAVATTDGRFVFGGMDGLTIFNPSRIRDNPFVPPVRITAIEVWSRNGKRTMPADEIDRLELDHRDSTFGFTFAALSFTDPARNRYAYRLRGFDDGWVDAGHRRTCQYTNLPPGSYVFEVRGSNNDGLWNDLGASLTVVVRPAVWQTWWFRLSTIATVAALIGSAVAYRRARRREMQRLRLRIADDLHDDLSSDLSGIAIVTDMVQRKETIEENDRRDLVAARDVALKMVDGVRDIVWYIDPEHDNLESTIIRMRHVAEMLLRSIPYRFSTELSDGSRTLPMTIRRNVLMVFKESLHNVVRHGRATEVRIELAAERDRLRLVIADNGVGFDVAGVEDDRHGLRGMRRRASEIDAASEIESRPGEGTRVVLAVDLTRTRDGRAAARGSRLKGGNRGTE